VQFNEAVQGFDDEADLVLVQTGTVSHGSIEVVDNGTGANYTVTFANVDGDGDLNFHRYIIPVLGGVGKI